jgi:hypothetical protein
MKKGDRVGAILSADKDTVKLIGYGVYMGDEVPDEKAGGFGKFLRGAGLLNPKILLDSGKVVWGCECWWGPEEETAKRIQGREVVNVDMDSAREG